MVERDGSLGSLHDEQVSEHADADPASGDVVRASFARQGLMDHLGARLVRVEPGAVDIEVDYSPTLTQQHGYFHGGLLTTLADTACGYAALTLAPTASEVLTVSLAVNFLAPARGQRLVAAARVVRAGRTVTVARAEVTTHATTSGSVSAGRGASENRGVQVATVTATLMRVAAPADAPPDATRRA